MKIYNNFIKLSVASALMASALPVFAGGLSIGTQSGSGVGNAYAGGAAAAEDASAVWYNPAGMTLLPGKTNIAVAAHVLKPSFKFRNSSSTLPIGTGDGGDGGGWHLIPQGYIAHKLTDSWSVGAGFNTPFGLETAYDRGWRGQSIGFESALKIYNINVAAAYKVNNMVSVGGGLNYQRAELKFNSITAIGFIEPKLHDDGVGYNIGVLFQPTQQTRVGAHYRSSIKYTATGSLLAPALIGGNSTASAGLATPDNFSFSVVHALSPRWDIMGDITWTGWSHLKRLDVVRTSGVASGTSPVSLTFNWTDTWRTSLGANYKHSDALKFRFGVAFDQTPTNDVDRTARLPDQDRTWIAFGAQWKVSKNGVLDFGYAHEFIKDASVNNRDSVTGLRLIGTFKNQADIFSVQYSHSF
jgi:long-chain fatty acid transport protein